MPEARQNPHKSAALAKNERRRKALARIHAIAKKAGLDDDARRDLQARVTGKASAADMTDRQLFQTIDALKALAGDEPNSKRDLIAKARAQWISLYWLGAVRDRSDKALSAFVRRQTGVERIEWMSVAEANKVIDGLKDWLRREGVQARAIPPVPGQASASKIAVLAELRRRLAGVGQPHEVAPPPLSPSQADAEIARLGAAWRAVQAEGPTS